MFHVQHFIGRSPGSPRSSSVCCATYKEALDRLLLLQQENEVSSWYMFSKSWNWSRQKNLRDIRSSSHFVFGKLWKHVFLCNAWERSRVLVWVLRMTNTFCVPNADRIWNSLWKRNRVPAKVKHWRGACRCAEPRFPLQKYAMNESGEA